VGNFELQIDRRTLWTPLGRFVAFGLAVTSIVCLFGEFFSAGSMRAWVCQLLLPASLLLAAIGYYDWRRNNGAFARMILLGVLTGLVAAVAYDVFRVPFVWSESWKLSRFVPPLKLFNVFPRFGAVILGQPVDQDSYGFSAYAVGWAYHFSNGASFGVMYVAMVGYPLRHHWAWGVMMAAGIEIAMLLSPYPTVFGLNVTPVFVIVTLTAHAIFGVTLGLLCRRWSPISGLVAV
jgi:hypothetical protein